MKIVYSIILILIFNLNYSCKKSNLESELSYTLREGRIAIRTVNNTLEFFDTKNSKKFTPIGYNYTQVQEFTWNNIQLSGHSTFNPEYYNNIQTKNVLEKLQNAGFNTIRIFLNPISISNPEGELNNQYILNICDFINKAETFNLSVIITMDMIPVSYYGTDIQTEEQIWWWNDQYIYDNEINLEIDFWTKLIMEFKTNSVPLQAILAYEIRNEFFFHPAHKPFSDNSAIIEHPNANLYNMSIESEREALLEASFINWSTSVRDAIRKIDTEALVTVGFYAPEPMGEISKIAITKSDLDFVDIHMYPEQASLNEYANYFGLSTNMDKLIIMGEFGIVEDQSQRISKAKNILLDWKDNAVSNYQINGWLIWTLDTEQGTSLSIPDKNNTIFEAFSPEE